MWLTCYCWSYKDFVHMVIATLDKPKALLGRLSGKSIYFHAAAAAAIGPSYSI